jgi:hypothetical protein
MRFNAPKKITWWIATILAVITLVAEFAVTIPFVSYNTGLILLAGFLVLWLGTFVKGM